ncbi:MAG: CpsD/CapB family tyrosine-protein kinase, partial [Acidobacteria bacterium]|nr:CpsD/CapB family tyrosine-protein kinase [Acidobacteriota bacterium]
AFRALRSSLLLSHLDRPPRVMLVTSALPGEGKTTVCANLGRTLAAFGSKVVLIDADLRRPRLHRAFKVPKDRGLANVLAHSAPVEDVIFPSQYPNLFVIPGGPCPPDPATLLHPDRTTHIVRMLTLERGFDFVLFDSPPVLVFADAFNLMQATEGVVLVARSMQTPKEALRSACEQIRKIKTPILGLVTNDESEEAGSASYYRYYHYRRGYYKKAMEARGGEEHELATGPTEIPAFDDDHDHDEAGTRAS